MAKFFIERPIFAIVISIIITLAGTLAAFQLPIAQYPQIAPPTVTVSTTYQGANADVVDQTVAQIIEQQVNGVENMVSMKSTSSDAGSYSLTVQFAPEANGDIAAVQTQNRVAQANAALPASVQRMGVTTTKASENMAMIFSLYSPNDAYDATFLKNYGSIYLVEDIKRVKGVASIREFGYDYAMRIWLQPDKMAQLGITTTDVSNALNEQNVQAPAGTLGKMPSGPDQEFQYSARVKGRLTEKADFENIIVRADSDGRFVRLKDVARVELGSRDYNVISENNGHPSTVFGVMLSSDANALETLSNVQQVIDDAEKRFPPGLKYKTIVDNSKFIEESMRELVKTFGEALFLVVLVVFIFLQTWRATLIPILAIPVSLIGTFGAFVALGFSINTLTLFAMVLAIGLVVDDAIVVIEAVEHHMRYSGLSPLDATKKAMSEVSGPIIAITFVLASVFVPVAFFSGTMGILYRQFALTVVVSMALSAFVALSLTPALCAMLLKPYDPNNHKGFIAKLFDKFNIWFDDTLEKYVGSLGKLIPKAKASMVFLIIVFIMTGALYKIVPSSFVPDEDQGFFITSISLPEAASLNRTTEVVRKIADEIRKQDGVQDTMMVAGFDLLGGGMKPNSAVIFTGLKPWAERKSPLTKVGNQVRQVFMKSPHIPEANVLAFNAPSLPGLGMVGGFTLMLENRAGSSIDEMDRISKEFLAAARKRPEIAMIYSTFRVDTPAFEFEVDREKAKSLGIPVTDVFNALQTNLGGVEVNDLNMFGRSYKVVMQADPQFRSNTDSTRFFFLKNSSGTMVPLNTLVKPKPINTAAVITRYNGVKAIQINGNTAPGYSSGQTIAALEEVAKQVLPDGFSYSWSGQSREEIISGNRAPILFALAVIFVFLTLAAFYESWSIPFAVLLSVPAGVFGAFLFQYLRQLENNVYMQIGLVLLIGLAARNAILVVEYAKIRVDEGMGIVEAAIEAGRLRFRAILMTAISFIIGVIPLAVATGAGAGARTTIGTSVIGGMTMATIIGVFIIPVLFVVVERISQAIKGVNKRNKATSFKG